MSIEIILYATFFGPPLVLACWLGWLAYHGRLWRWIVVMLAVGFAIDIWFGSIEELFCATDFKPQKYCPGTLVGAVNGWSTVRQALENRPIDPPSEADPEDDEP